MRTPLNAVIGMRELPLLEAPEDPMADPRDADPYTGPWLNCGDLANAL